ncbi:MAG: STAS domain-containing protein [Planctomycetota bacterium]
MGIQNVSEEIILIDLPHDGAKRADELKTVNEIVSKKNDCHVIVDFSNVEIINSWNISNLLILRGLLQESGHQLILCGVATVTKCIFVVAGLSDVFVFTDDRPAALEAIRNAEAPASAHG